MHRGHYQITFIMSIKVKIYDYCIQLFIFNYLNLIRNIIDIINLAPYAFIVKWRRRQ